MTSLSQALLKQLFSSKYEELDTAWDHKYLTD